MDSENLQQQINNLPIAPGVYIFRNADGDALYVGKSVRLRERVKSYFQTKADLGPRTSKMVGETDKIDHIQTATEFEALLLEADLIKRLKPRYNVQWRDDKRYKYIKIRNSKFEIRNLRNRKEVTYWPSVTTSRKKDSETSDYFGPFPEGRTVSRVLKTLRKIFPWCKYKDADALKRAGRPCFYYHINQCPGICNGKITLAEYWEIIDNLIEFLSGNKQELIQKYQKAMQQAAQEGSFKRAARFRDKLRNLGYIIQQFRESSEYIKNPNLIQDIRAQEIEELKRIILGAGTPKTDKQGTDTRKQKTDDAKTRTQLSAIENQSSALRTPPSDFKIEAYDISNLGADHTTASRVVFIGGEPDRGEYRRYKIKLKNTPDDIAAIREVISRRFKHVSANHSAIQPSNHLPDLLLVDGGKGQVGAALEVLATKNIKVPVIGLAKKEETLIIPSNNNIGHRMSDKLKLPPNSPALQLLQRVRDEAHCFTQKYHKHLRRKANLPTS